MPARDVKRGKSSSRRKRPRADVASVTKKVRMTEDDAARLARLAKETGKSESDVLREGILLVEKMDRRRRAIDGLIAMAERDGPEPPKIYWEGR